MPRRRTPQTRAGRWAALAILLCGCPEDVALPSFGTSPDDLPADAMAGGTGGGTTGNGLSPGGSGGSADAGEDANVDGGPIPEGGATGGETRFGTPVDPACDLNGVWAARQTTVSSALNGDQIATNWYLFTLRQEGTELEVLEHTDCGIYVRSASNVVGAIEVTIARDTLAILAHKNPQAGRQGEVTLSADGSRCQVQLDRFYSTRGAAPESYLPRGPHDPRDLDALMAEAPMPSDDAPAGAEDWNGPAQQGPGVAWVVSGAASGVRWSVQRDWTEYASDADHVTTAATPLSSVVLGARFANEENVLSTSAGILGGLLASVATPITDDPRNQLELLLLSPPDGAPHPIMAVEEVGARCLEVQKLLPHLEP